MMRGLPLWVAAGQQVKDKSIGEIKNSYWT